MSEANYPQAQGSACVDFQTAPYEQLCGCVSAEIPPGAKWMWDKPNPHATEHLIRQATGRRMVCANCPDCGGTGITPNT
jgi:hypothetical protein